MFRAPQPPSTSTYCCSLARHSSLALKDEAGNFSWVEFKPKFHSHLFKCAFSLLGELITSAAQRMYKKAIFVYILELLNQEGEDTFFTSSHDHEKIVRTNWNRKQTLPPSELTTLDNTRERCCEDAVSAKADQIVEVSTPNENPPANPPVVDTAIVQQPLPTPSPDEPITAIVTRHYPTVENFMLWWKQENPGDPLLCEGTRTRACDNPDTHVKMHGSFSGACYPKCEFHSSSNCETIPNKFL